MSRKSLSVIAAATVALCAGAAQADTTNGFANGGFEVAYVGAPVAGQGPAANWLWGGNSSYTLDANAANAHSGSFSVLLNCGSLCSTVLVQNSVKDGGLPDLTVGDTPLLTFWVKGSLGTTGSDNFQLQYLDSIGNILYNSGAKPFTPTDTYAQISFQGGAVPLGAVAAYLQISQGIGPTGAQGGAGEIFTEGNLSVDDVYLGVFTEGEVGPPPIPEPETYALMLMGLAAVGVAARRRRAA